MKNKLPFEFTTLFVDGKKKNNNSSLVVIAIVNGVKAYLQIDTGCPVTILDDDFLKQKLRKKGFEISSNHIKGKWFTTQYAHTENIEIIFSNKITFKPEITYIEKDQTKEETKNQKTVSRWNLPFAGYIGLDFFEGKIFEINYKKRVLIFYNNSSKFNFPKENTLKIEKKLILLPTKLQNTTFYAVFDTASSAYYLILEQSLFQKIFGKIRKKKYNIIKRPDFLARDYYIEINDVPLQIGSFVYLSNKGIVFSTVDKKTNAYFFGEKLEYMHSAILGNLPFLKHSLIIDLQINKFLIK